MMLRSCSRESWICKAATLGTMAASLLLVGCQPEPSAATREYPERSGPFGHVGYRSMRPNPIPQSEMPQTEISAYMACTEGLEQRDAANWVRDWFAAISRLDRCDEWAADVLASPRVRQGLVYILDRSTEHNKQVAQCRHATFRMFTTIEEMHGRIAALRDINKLSCDTARRREVVAKREEAFTKALTSMSESIGQYKQRSTRS
jgi:hypothetical protein